MMMNSGVDRFSFLAYAILVYLHNTICRFSVAPPFGQLLADFLGKKGPDTCPVTTHHFDHLRGYGGSNTCPAKTHPQGL